VIAAFDAEQDALDGGGDGDPLGRLAVTAAAAAVMAAAKLPVFGTSICGSSSGRAGAF
jgi:hypothetical protein